MGGDTNYYYTRTARSVAIERELVEHELNCYVHRIYTQGPGLANGESVLKTLVLKSSVGDWAEIAYRLRGEVEVVEVLLWSSDAFLKSIEGVLTQIDFSKHNTIL